MSGIKNYFETNPYAANVGQAVQGATGLAGMYMNISDTVKTAEDTQFNIPTLMDNNPYESPSYNLGAGWTQQAAFDPKAQGKGMIGQSVMAGAGAGAAIGSMASPIGGAIGAAAGAITGLISGAFGKRATRRKAEEAKARETAQLQGAQSSFNEAASAYDMNMDARDRYEKRLTNRRRRIQTVIG